MKTTIRQVEDFLALKRVAVVGVSRNPKEFELHALAGAAPAALRGRAGQPGDSEIDGQRCYASVAEIEPPVEGALIMTPPAVTERVVEECVGAGVTHVWLYGGFARNGRHEQEGDRVCRGPRGRRRRPAVPVHVPAGDAVLPRTPCGRKEARGQLSGARVGDAARRPSSTGAGQGRPGGSPTRSRPTSGRAGLEASVVSVGECDIGSLAAVDFLLLGCWTNGLFVIGQHPDEPWLAFARDLPGPGATLASGCSRRTSW